MPCEIFNGGIIKQMSSSIYIRGKEYLSSKDACAVSGYSKNELDKLCRNGSVRTLWFKDGYFIESRSLLAYTAKGYPLGVLGGGFFIKRKIFFKKFGGLVAALLILISVLMLPIMLIEQPLSKDSLGYAPSTYNSTQYISDKTGAVASLAEINNTVADLIEKGLYGIYNGWSTFVR